MENTENEVSLSDSTVISELEIQSEKMCIRDRYYTALMITYSSLKYIGLLEFYFLVGLLVGVFCIHIWFPEHRPFPLTPLV